MAGDKGKVGRERKETYRWRRWGGERKDAPGMERRGEGKAEGER